MKKSTLNTIVAGVIVSYAAVMSAAVQADTRICTAIAKWDETKETFVTADEEVSLVLAVSDEIVTIIDTLSNNDEISYAFKGVNSDGNFDYRAIRGAELTMFKDHDHGYISNSDGSWVLQNCSSYE